MHVFNITPKPQNPLKYETIKFNPLNKLLIILKYNLIQFYPVLNHNIWFLIKSGTVPIIASQRQDTIVAEI